MSQPISKKEKAIVILKPKYQPNMTILSFTDEVEAQGFFNEIKANGKTPKNNRCTEGVEIGAAYISIITEVFEAKVNLDFQPQTGQKN